MHNDAKYKLDFSISLYIKRNWKKSETMILDGGHEQNSPGKEPYTQKDYIKMSNKDFKICRKPI